MAVFTVQIEAGQFADSSIMCGFLQYSEKSKIWQKVWCVIPEKEGMVLYLYGAPQVKHEAFQSNVYLTGFCSDVMRSLFFPLRM